LPLSNAITADAQGDACIAKKLFPERHRIARVIEAIARAFRRGAGCFMSARGRAGGWACWMPARCPPTFGTRPIGQHHAAKRGAFGSRSEGAEDDAEAAASLSVPRHYLGENVVLGIAPSNHAVCLGRAASGQTARRDDRAGVLQPISQDFAWPAATIVIAPNLGPELLTGSTRLKAGASDETTIEHDHHPGDGASGKVRSNLMIDLNPANVEATRTARCASCRS